jgi:hypothetical protein
MNAIKLISMKKYHILLAAFMVIMLYLLSSCCKDGDCKKDFRDKYVGTYQTHFTDVTNHRYFLNDTTIKDSIITQEIQKIGKSNLSIKYAYYGHEMIDTVVAYESGMIFYNNLPDRKIHGNINYPNLYYEKDFQTNTVTNVPIAKSYFHGIKQ